MKESKTGRAKILNLTSQGINDKISSEVDSRKTIAPETNCNSKKHTACDFFNFKEIEKAYKKVLFGKKDYYVKNTSYNFLALINTQFKEFNNNVYKFKNRKRKNLLEIKQKLNNKTYKISPFSCLFVSQTGKKDRRPLSIPCISDRIVYGLVLDEIRPLIIPLLNKYNIFGSHTNPKAREMASIMKKITENSQKNKYVLKVDITKFFPSINRRLLIDKLNNLIEGYKLTDKQEYLFNFIFKAINNKIEDKNSSTLNEKELIEKFKKEGIPQGCAFSPLLANYYALDLDECLNEKGYNTFRYLDDMIIFADSMHECKTVIWNHIKRVCDNLSLIPHEISDLSNDKTFCMSTNKPFTYLGVEFLNGKKRIINKTKDKFKHKVSNYFFNPKALMHVKKEEDFRKLIEEIIARYIIGWKAFYDMCDNYDIVKDELNKFLIKKYKKVIPAKYKFKESFLI